MNAEQGQGYEETDVSDTLNVFDNSEARTPTLIKQAVDVYNQTENGDIAPTITAAVGGATQAEQKCLKSVGGGTTYQPEGRGNPADARSRDLQAGRDYAGRIVSCGFKHRQGSAAKGIGYEREVAPTLPASSENAVLITKDE